MQRTAIRQDISASTSCELSRRAAPPSSRAKRASANMVVRPHRTGPRLPKAVPPRLSSSGLSRGPISRPGTVVHGSAHGRAALLGPVRPDRLTPVARWVLGLKPRMTPRGLSIAATHRVSRASLKPKHQPSRTEPRLPKAIPPHFGIHLLRAVPASRAVGARPRRARPHFAAE